jgi:ubiquinone/menaquinone biosynthesis C-methylase UbiE
MDRVAGRTLRERVVGRGWELFTEIDAAFEHGEITQAEWHARVGAIIGPAYLAADNPRAQSGSANSPEQWERARRFIFAAITRPGTFLDVGAASGHLMQCAVEWLARDGLHIEPYGVEIVPELADLARQRLPHWADRIVTANAATWLPQRRFDFVRTGLEYVPHSRRMAFVQHLLDRVVAPGGRLIVGAFSEMKESPPQLESEVAGWGFPIAGRVEVPHTEDYRVSRRAFWIDNSV